MVPIVDKTKVIEILDQLPTLRFDEIERYWVEIVLNRCRGNRQRAADTLGITVYSVRKIIERWDISSIWEKYEDR